MSLDEDRFGTVTRNGAGFCVSGPKKLSPLNIHLSNRAQLFKPLGPALFPAIDLRD